MEHIKAVVHLISMLCHGAEIKKPEVSSTEIGKNAIWLEDFYWLSWRFRGRAGCMTV